MSDMLSEIEKELKRADFLTESALTQLNSKNWRKAIETYGAVLKITPTNKVAKNGIETARKRLAQADTTVAAGNAQLLSGQYSAAENNFQSALKADPGNQRAKEELATLFRTVSDEYKEKGNAGVALHFLTRVLDFKPGDTAIKERINILEASIYQRIICSVSVIPFKEYKKDPDFSERLSKNLQQLLVGSEQKFIRVTDQRRLENALSDSGINLENLADTKKLDGLKSIKDVQVIVAGKISSFKITSDKNRERQAKKYQTGTTQKRNPEYDVALADVRNATIRSEALRRAADQAGGGLLGFAAKIVTGGVAGSDVGSANAKLAQTPEFTDEPVYGNWNYSIVHHTKSAEALIAIRLIDTETESVLLEESIPVTVTRTFDTIDNPNPTIGVTDKPIPDDIDEALKSDAIEKITSKFVPQFNAMMSRFAIKYVHRAEALRQQNHSLEAAEAYFNFRFAVKNSEAEFAPDLAKAAKFIDSIPLLDRNQDKQPTVIRAAEPLEIL